MKRILALRFEKILYTRVAYVQVFIEGSTAQVLRINDKFWLELFSGVELLTEMTTYPRRVKLPVFQHPHQKCARHTRYIRPHS